MGKERDGNVDSMDKEGVVMVVLEWSTVADMDLLQVQREGWSLAWSSRPRRGGRGGPTYHLENIFSGAYISISSKACCTVDNLVSALSYMYISLMFILIYRKSENFVVMKIIHVLNIHIILFSWVYGTL